jgi:hypothetical protein
MNKIALVLTLLISTATHAKTPRFAKEAKKAEVFASTRWKLKLTPSQKSAICIDSGHKAQEVIWTPEPPLRGSTSFMVQTGDKAFPNLRASFHSKNDQNLDLYVYSLMSDMKELPAEFSHYYKNHYITVTYSLFYVKGKVSGDLTLMALPGDEDFGACALTYQVKGEPIAEEEGCNQ